jgi:hypothetical protein
MSVRASLRLHLPDMERKGYDHTTQEEQVPERQPGRNLLARISVRLTCFLAGEWGKHFRAC